MKNIKILLSFFGFTLMMLSCSSESTFHPDYVLTRNADTTMTVNIDANTTYQTIDGFASSDAWNMDFIGKYWSQNSKDDIAKMLFSQKITNGQPEGIGLSMWRVNLGGGTAEQGDESGIEQEERRAECFLNSDGSYNWNKAAGQQYFMQKAKNYSVKSFVFFSNTPPVFYTKNGKGYSDSKANSNLKDDCYDKFADFLATTALHFKEQGYSISYISPVNEPQYNWSSGQEGSGWQNSEVVKLVRNLDQSLTSKGLDSTNILVDEAGAWNDLYEADATAGNGRSDVINDFFNPSSSDYIGNLKHVPALICAHSYWLDTSWDQLQSTRQKVNAAAKAKNLKVYQTEWSMMSSNYDLFSNYDNATPMDLALTLSEVIHADLTQANVSSWAFWTACDRERWNQKSRFFLIRLIPVSGDYGSLTEGGTCESTKNLWVLGYYSLFIRPGYKRVSVSLPVSGNQFFASAYISPGKDKLVIVYTNTKTKSVKVDNHISIQGRTTDNPIEYITTSGSNLQMVSSYDTTIIPSRSVATIIYDLKS